MYKLYDEAARILQLFYEAASKVLSSEDLIRLSPHQALALPSRAQAARGSLDRSERKKERCHLERSEILPCHFDRSEAYREISRLPEPLKSGQVARDDIGLSPVETTYETEKYQSRSHNSIEGGTHFAERSNTTNIKDIQMNEAIHFSKKQNHTKKIIQLVISDFLDHEAFTLKGLAHELRIPVDSLSNLYVNEYNEPSCSLAIKLLQLHSEMFPALYIA